MITPLNWLVTDWYILGRDSLETKKLKAQKYQETIKTQGRVKGMGVITTFCCFALLHENTTPTHNLWVTLTDHKNSRGDHRNETTPHLQKWMQSASLWQIETKKVRNRSFSSHLPLLNDHCRGWWWWWVIYFELSLRFLWYIQNDRLCLMHKHIVVVIIHSYLP